jgi:hypothetical protein
MDGDSSTGRDSAAEKDPYLVRQSVSNRPQRGTMRYRVTRTDERFAVAASIITKRLMEIISH